MKFKTKFFGTPIELADAKFGDLLVSNDENTARLLLVVKGSQGDQRGAVLAEWGVPSRIPVPYAGAVVHIIDQNHMLRRIDGDIIVQPLGDEADDSLLRQQMANGALAIFHGGEIGIRIAPDQGSTMWSIKTGDMIDMSNAPSKYWMSKWKLLWRDGDDTITLAEFNGVVKTQP